MPTPSVNTKKVEDLSLRVVNDMGGAFTMALGYIGDRLGLFRILAQEGPMSSVELAQKMGLNERYVREWAKALVAADYLDYDPKSGRIHMTEEQAQVLAKEDSPTFVGGAFHFTTPSIYNVPKILEAFKKGGGIAYSEIGEEIPEAIERFFRPAYVNFLARDWVGVVPGLAEKLQRGALVADVGCGAGQSSVALAKAYPKSKVVGVDNDARSIQRAQKLKSSQRVDNVEFMQAPAHELPKNKKYDLICSFDCIHDMADPRKTLRTLHDSLADDGVYLWSEPATSDQPLENRNPVGRAFAAVSPLHCLTVSLASHGEGLGTQLGLKGVQELAREAGFTSVEPLPIQNPLHRIYALRR